MEVLFPHTTNKTAHKALEDTTNAGKTHAQTWGEKRKEKKTDKKPQHCEA